MASYKHWFAKVPEQGKGRQAIGRQRGREASRRQTGRQAGRQAGRRADKVHRY